MKKGFTLVELAAVVIILSVVGLIVLLSISNRMKTNKEELYKDQLLVLKQAAENWSISDPDNLPDENIQRIVVTLGTLKEFGFMNDNFINPLTDENFSDTFQVVITYVNGNYRYEVNESTANSTGESLDNKVPVLTAKSGDIIITKGTSVNTSEYFNAPVFGSTGGSVSCNPSNTSTLEAGTHEIKCTAIGKNGKSTTATKTIVVDYEQIVNYTMLYDNSYKDAELNQMKDITGGWVSANSWTQLNVSTYKTTEYIGFGVVSGNPLYGSSIGPATNNLVDISDYSAILSQSSFNLTGLYDGAAHFNFVRTSPNIDSTYGRYAGSAFKVYDYQKVTEVGEIEKTIVVDFIPSDITYTSVYLMCTIAGNYSSAYLYNMALLKADDYETLVTLANLSNITSIADIVGSSANCSQLLSNEAAVRYMIKRCTGDFMASAINSSTFLTSLESSPYKNLVYGNAHWAKFLNMVK